MQLIRNMLPLWKSSINYAKMQHVWAPAWLKLSDVSRHDVSLIIWVSAEWVVQMVWLNIQVGGV
jgi:hypothetical protein